MAERIKKVPLWYKAASVGTVVALSACQLGEIFGWETPPPEGTSTTLTETALATDSTSETKTFAGMLIGEAGIGRIVTFTQNENPDPVFVATVKDRALEELRTGDSSLDPKRINVYDFEMQGELGNSPFPLIAVSQKDNPDRLQSLFVGFGEDESGVLVPPEEGKIDILLRLITAPAEEGGIVAIGVQDRSDLSAIYSPALFEVSEASGEVVFFPPYADTVDESVPFSAGKAFYSIIAPVPIETPIPTETPNAEATAMAEFETKKAEALSMVSIKLETPEDFATLPVLDDVTDFDSGKVQEMEYWLIENVLPPADIMLPKSWRTACNDATGFCFMSWNHISEPDVNIYRGISAFFVMQDGKKMLRMGVEYGGAGQLIHFNFEDPKWWTDPTRMKTLIAAFSHTDVEMAPISEYGTNNVNWLTPDQGYLIYSDASSSEGYTKKVTLQRSADGNQFTIDWVNNRLLSAGADKTVFGVRFSLIVK